MKKFFTFAIAAIAFISASAQSAELLFGETEESARPVKNGDVYETGYVLDTQQSIFYRYKQNSDLWIRGAKGTFISLDVKSDNSLAVCSVDGSCVNLNATNNFHCFKSGILGQSKTDVPEGQIITMDALIDNVTTIRSSTGTPDDATIADQMKTITAEITFTAMGETEDDDVELTITVIMHNKPASEVGAVDGIIADDPNVATEYFNLLGHKVANPGKGVYIVRRGNKVTKQIFR